MEHLTKLTIKLSIRPQLNAIWHININYTMYRGSIDLEFLKYSELKSRASKFRVNT